ncbi:negative regulator of flagellin synthesis FlgM [Caldalkalibacillus uzonensis]|uniref:Negative regulator of flagellin synthesis n=1 Tax=Caldalkalibacillus uzonensis TaxID=353224 RepID=A0ABU0CTZ3_9BACI|nr:flagellar biosynthesis anti-sigma factor FlgM [Caldalkalibacillus uzonensis]MDQ0339898.1 negative regulator of flagellin synthesis FlgM [Caldalkalibacillus uzonensis]
MKIDQTHGLWRPNPYQQQQVSKSVQKKGKMGQDQVHISKEAKVMLEKQNQTNVHTDRQAKLERIKEQLEKGTYQVNSKKVAERVFDFWFRSS